MIIVIITLILSILMLKYCLNIKIKDLLEIKKEINNDTLNKISNKLPNNIEICKEILKTIKNENVQIEENKESNTSLYLALNNKIIIGNKNNTYTRIQTIAHECIHSIQNKKVLIANYIISNIRIAILIVLAILLILKIINTNQAIYISIYCIIGIINFIIRNALETDAIIKSKYLAKEYIEKTKILTQNEEKILIENYTKIDKIGVNFYTFSLISKTIISTIILCLISLL